MHCFKFYICIGVICVCVCACVCVCVCVCVHVCVCVCMHTCLLVYRLEGCVGVHACWRETEGERGGWESACQCVCTRAL